MEETNKTIQSDLQESRSTIVEKLRLVEERMNQAVDDAQSAAGTFRDTFASLKSSLDIKAQVSNHPLTFAVGSVLLGGLIGSSLTKPQVRSELDSTEFNEERHHWKQFANKYESELQFIKEVAVVLAAEFLMEASQKKSPKIAPYLQILATGLKKKLSQPH